MEEEDEEQTREQEEQGRKRRENVPNAPGDLDVFACGPNGPGRSRLKNLRAEVTHLSENRVEENSLAWACIAT